MSEILNINCISKQGLRLSKVKRCVIGCPETSARNYHYSLRNNPEEHSYHLLLGGSLQSFIYVIWRVTEIQPLSGIGYLEQILIFYICGSVHHAFIVKIIPTRCNNCGLFFANALLYIFRVTIPPIIRSTCAVCGHR